ncbi:CvfB family protein [Reinekea thalattae]|uniref:GntR family transcriptional regulator n=1 Tax=Reinekea thalattae TaxID=2593301 RepID=A0A5C8ZBM7_9GAMM|nr:S1-like domain-containing RNA-binding protein [Reinekea thalattae]TXR54689.1 GntR family transcriptional regulator [Reinekea thalattae]
MAQIGKFNTLEVVSIADFGVYLDGENLDTILLPKRQVPADTEIGDWINVFIYLDSEDRLIATTDKPLVEVGQCALLSVKDVNKFGAFLDWGLPKDLLVPYGEQRKPMEVGQRHVVYLYIDEYTQRITGSAKLSNFLREESHNHQTGDRVDLMVINRTDIGYKVIIDELYLGVVHNMDVLQPLKPGQRLTGYVKQVRDDNKLDIALQLQGQEARDDISARILAELERNGGVLNLGDKSSPEEIYAVFQTSKGNFKKAVGGLLKQQKITAEAKRIVQVKA